MSSFHKHIEGNSRGGNIFSPFWCYVFAYYFCEFFTFLNKFGISALHIVIFRLTYLEAVVLSFNVKQTEYIFIT